MRGNLDDIKYEFRGYLCYPGDGFVEVKDVNDRINGALVEIHSEVHHYLFRKTNHDSFNQIIEQIMVLQGSVASIALQKEEREPRWADSHETYHSSAKDSTQAGRFPVIHEGERQ